MQRTSPWPMREPAFSKSNITQVAGVAALAMCACALMLNPITMYTAGPLLCAQNLVENYFWASAKAATKNTQQITHKHRQSEDRRSEHTPQVLRKALLGAFSGCRRPPNRLGLVWTKLGNTWPSLGQICLELVRFAADTRELLKQCSKEQCSSNAGGCSERLSKDRRGGEYFFGIPSPPPPPSPRGSIRPNHRCDILWGVIHKRSITKVCMSEERKVWDDLDRKNIIKLPPACKHAWHAILRAPRSDTRVLV